MSMHHPYNIIYGLLFAIVLSGVCFYQKDFITLNETKLFFYYIYKMIHILIYMLQGATFKSGRGIFKSGQIYSIFSIFFNVFNVQMQSFSEEWTFKLDPFYSKKKNLKIKCEYLLKGIGFF